MTFGEKLKIARTSAGLKQAELAKQLNTTGNTISNWENNVSKPDLDMLSYICGVLNVKASFFLEAKIPEDEVSLSEFKIIKKYRDLDNHGRKMVDFTLQEEWERSKAAAENEANHISSFSKRVISYYFKNASAGSGQLIFDDLPENDIEIPDIPKYKSVSYAIGINGSSMEPAYHDGDILLVEATREIEIGEIGIFQIDGNCFVKKLGETELISLNKDYPNVPLNESATTLGRVIDKL